MATSTTPRQGFDRGLVTFGALLAAFACWSVVAAVLGGRLEPELLAYAGGPVLLFAALLGGRWLVRTGRRSVLAWVVGIALFMVTLGGLLPREKPAVLPMVYPNANAALGIQLAALAGALWLLTGRLAWRFAALAGLVIAWTNASNAGLVLIVPVLLVVWTGRRTGRSWWTLGGVLGLIGSGAAAVAVLQLARTTSLPARVEAAFSPTRHALWREALELWSSSRIVGHGPGVFRTSAAVPRDPDLATAHSVWLQAGAEVGLVGIVLLALITLAGTWLCLRHRTTLGAIAGLAWTALWTQSAIDHLFEFVPVLVGAGLVLGVAAAQNSSMSPSDNVHAPAGGGVDARGREVSTGPGMGTGTNPDQEADRTPMA